jgi:hypothetical protein
MDGVFFITLFTVLRLAAPFLLLLFVSALVNRFHYHGDF